MFQQLFKPAVQKFVFCNSILFTNNVRIGEYFMKALGPCLKTIVSWLIYGCCIYLISCSEGTIPTASDKANIVVSGFIYNNEQVNDIRVVNTTPAGTNDTTIIVFDSTLDDFDTMRIMPKVPINNAIVTIYANGTAYPLESSNDSGYYSDPDTSIIVTSGATYRIEVKYQGKIAVAETIVPQTAPSLTLSRDTLVRERGGGRPRPGQDTTTATTVDTSLYSAHLQWSNPEGSPYYIVLEQVENVQTVDTAKTIDTTKNIDTANGQNNRQNNRPNNGGGLNRGRGYFTRGNTISLTTARVQGGQGRQRNNVSSLRVNRPGTYVIRIYRVNGDYRELDQFIRQQDSAERQGTGLFLEEPPSNVVGGLGIFAAFASSVITIQVVDQQ